MPSTLPDHIYHIYHMAEAANWPSIREYGLLPATDLIARAGLIGADRDILERAQRPDHTVLPKGAEIRDQKPMPTSALRACLVGLTPADWCALINARVFFWFDPDRLNRQRAACGSRPQVVLTFDAPALVAAYEDMVALTPINTGNARRAPARRSAATFVPYESWIESGWASEVASLGTKERSRSHAPVELTVVGPIPDASRFVLAVTELGDGEAFTSGVVGRGKAGRR